MVTLGGRGALVIDGTGRTEVASPKVAAVDTTGAGDAFVGALVTQLAAGDDLVEAARRAVRVAAVSVTRRGAQASYPTRGEVDSSEGYGLDHVERATQGCRSECGPGLRPGRAGR